MRKLITLALFTILLTGCISVNVPADDSKSKEPITQQETPNNTPAKETETREGATKDGTAQDAYIIDTFAQYGYTAPERSQWIVDQQGPHKVAVIIKENVGQGKPNISKLVFLWNDDAESTELLHVMINNTTQFGSDQ
ncbi:hypothetical protein [Erysipelothrix anatis]|uniref:hypothetical protein n=1 Tax=Erysipelothrix anatis TaxID=2683713 RepID=UPI0013595A96|nr:hypothetical protein [Erysipelothrix anatis]